MKARKCLFLADPNDNVLTALSNLQAGEEVPILSSQGDMIGTVKMLSSVPIYFKVARQALYNNEPVRKLGHEIGRVVARVVEMDHSAREIPGIIETGSPIHLTNFIPTSRIITFWGGALVNPMTVIAERYWKGQSLHAPYELGVAKKNFGPGQYIHVHELKIDPQLISLLPTDEGFVIGRALEPIAAGNLIRLGCCSGGVYRYLGDEKMIQTISQVYRFFKGRFYEIA